MAEARTEARIVEGILDRNEHIIRRHLILSRTVVDKLRDRRIIPEHVRKEIIIQDEPTQVRTLVRELRGRGLDTLRSFLDVLRETGHGWLADRIMDSKAIDYAALRGRGHHQHQHRPHPSQLSPRPRRHVTIDTAPPKYFQEEARERGWQTNRGLYDRLSVGEMMNPPRAAPDTIRGQIKPRDILDDGAYKPARYSEMRASDDYADPWRRPLPGGQRAYVPPPDAIPNSIYSLGNFFRTQKVTNAQALTQLKQEEIAIRQLLEQNARDQMKVVHSQYAIDEIDQRIQEINVHASKVYDTTGNADISRYRLRQLNQIPWTVRR